MNNTLTTKVVFFLCLGMAATLPVARGDEWNQRTVITLREPAEVPGQVLPAGTYIFKLANSRSHRHIVQVFNKDENRVLGTFLAIPSHRAGPAEKPIVRFEERAAGSPQAIKAWFYPGRTIGHEFVYAREEAVELAKANQMPVPAIPHEFMLHTSVAILDLNAPEIEAMASAPLKVEEPNGQEVELAEASLPAGDGGALPKELPKTASQTPLIGLAGLLSLGAAVLLRFRTARAK